MSELQDQLRQYLPAAACAGAGALLAYRCWQNNAKLPPGPIGLPIIGMLPWLTGEKRHLTALKLCEKYGDIVSCRVGAQLFVIINKYENIKEALDSDDFAGKPVTPFTMRATQGCGIFLNQGPMWAFHRRSTLRIMRDFGFARQRSAEMIDSQLDDIEVILKDASANSKPVHILETFTEATNGVIASLALNKRLRRPDPEFDFVNDSIKKFFSSPVFLNLPILFPGTDMLVRHFPEARMFEKLMQDLNQYIREQIRLREANLSDDAEPECLADALIQEKRKAEAAGDFETYKDMQLIRIVLEFFIAGTDTTARTLEWLLLYASCYPEKQRKLQAELDAELGRSRRPTMGDRQRLPYACAFIEETLRYSSLASMGIPHCATRDTEFKGYRIPKGAFILSLVYGVSYDAEVWGDPENFRPERFLDDQGRFKGAGKNIPFLIGKRSCVGEGLARMEMFMMMTAVMQRYRARLTDESSARRDEILTGRMGLLRIPGDYRMLFESRE